MIKNKEKRLVCIIVLSLSIVSLVTAVVSGFVCGIVDFIYTIKDSVDSHYSYRNEFISDTANLLQVLIAGAFAAAFFFNKKRYDLVNLVLVISQVALFVIFSIVLCTVVKSYNTYMSYAALSLTLMISSGLTLAARRLLPRFDEEKSERNDASDKKE